MVISSLCTHRKRTYAWGPSLCGGKRRVWRNLAGRLWPLCVHRDPGPIVLCPVVWIQAKHRAHFLEHFVRAVEFISPQSPNFEGFYDLDRRNRTGGSISLANNRHFPQMSDRTGPMAQKKRGPGSLDAHFQARKDPKAEQFCRQPWAAIVSFPAKMSQNLDTHQDHIC